MEKVDSINVLTALGQPTRLDAFRLLVQHEPEGLAAGNLARALNIPQNTMSTHLSILAQAGLVRSERRSRSVIYRAELEQLSRLLLFLLQDCCGGHPALCAPLIDNISSCQPAEGKCG